MPSTPASPCQLPLGPPPRPLSRAGATSTFRGTTHRDCSPQAPFCQAWGAGPQAWGGRETCNATDGAPQGPQPLPRPVHSSCPCLPGLLPRQSSCSRRLYPRSVGWASGNQTWVISASPDPDATPSQSCGGKARERGCVAFLRGLKPRAVSQTPRVAQHSA